MNEHRYILEPYKGMNTRHHCPGCKNKEKTFVRYIDSLTGNSLDSKFGRCNRESNCGYHVKPPIETKCFFVPFQTISDYSNKAYQITTSKGIFYLPKSQVFEIIGNGCYASEWILSEGDILQKPEYSLEQIKSFSDGKASVYIPQPTIEVICKLEPSFITPELFKQSLKGYDQNNFVNFLISLFGEEITGGLIERYFIGTSKHWPGSTTFWQIDTKRRIRDGKVIQYEIQPDEKSNIGIDCKRSKTNIPPVEWVHSLTKQQDFKLKQCLYGEHLLTDKAKPVAIVESEKTAIISSVYLPQFIWLAVGAITELKLEKCLVLAGRRVVLYPDLNGFDKWTVKAKELTERIPGIHFVISDLLEKLATIEERTSGLDLADYLIRFDLQQFKINPAVDLAPEKSERSEKGERSENILFFSNGISDNTQAIGPDHWLNSIHLLPSMAISDSSKFIESLTFYRQNN